MPKYTGTRSIVLTTEQYEELFKDRDIDSIRFTSQFRFSKKYTESGYRVYEHIWSHGDKLYKLAEKYFDDVEMFWLIGLMNDKPTDAHYKYGDVVLIPVDWIQFYRDATE